jgi:hypothetical protein
MDMYRDAKPLFGERLPSPIEAADFLGLSLSWLAKARLRCDGPRFVKIGRAVRRSRASESRLVFRSRSLTCSTSFSSERILMQVGIERTAEGAMKQVT